MPHPIFGPPEHKLEVVSVRLTLPSRRNSHVTILAIEGESSTSKRPLWRYQETWTERSQRKDLEPTDTLHYVALAACQDRPPSQAALEAALRPGGWQDVPLPF